MLLRAQRLWARNHMRRSRRIIDSEYMQAPPLRISIMREGRRFATTVAQILIFITLPSAVRSRHYGVKSTVLRHLKKRKKNKCPGPSACIVTCLPWVVICNAPSPRNSYFYRTIRFIDTRQRDTTWQRYISLSFLIGTETVVLITSFPRHIYSAPAKDRG